MSARTIFSMAINYMRGHVMSALENSFPDIKQRDVMFVITVPAIWNNASKQFMREAAFAVFMLMFNKQTVASGLSNNNTIVCALIKTY